MVVVVELRDGNHQQAVLLAGVATHDGRAVIGPALVGAQHLFRQRLIEVDHQGFVKIQITHEYQRVMVFANSQTTMVNSGKPIFK